MTPDELARIRKRHQTSKQDGRYCMECGQDWPCDAARLLAERDLAASSSLTRSGTSATTFVEIKPEDMR